MFRSVKKNLEANNMPLRFVCLKSKQNDLI